MEHKHSGTGSEHEQLTSEEKAQSLESRVAVLAFGQAISNTVVTDSQFVPASSRPRTRGRMLLEKIFAFKNSKKHSHTDPSNAGSTTQSVSDGGTGQIVSTIAATVAKPAPAPEESPVAVDSSVATSNLTHPASTLDSLVSSQPSAPLPTLAKNLPLANSTHNLVEPNSQYRPSPQLQPQLKLNSDLEHESHERHMAQNKQVSALAQNASHAATTISQDNLQNTASCNAYPPKENKDKPAHSAHTASVQNHVLQSTPLSSHTPSQHEMPSLVISSAATPSQASSVDWSRFVGVAKTTTSAPTSQPKCALHTEPQAPKEALGYDLSLYGKELSNATPFSQSQGKSGLSTQKTEGQATYGEGLSVEQAPMTSSFAWAVRQDGVASAQFQSLSQSQSQSSVLAQSDSQVHSISQVGAPAQTAANQVNSFAVSQGQSPTAFATSSLQSTLTTQTTFVDPFAHSAPRLHYADSRSQVSPAGTAPVTPPTTTYASAASVALPNSGQVQGHTQALQASWADTRVGQVRGESGALTPASSPALSSVTSLNSQYGNLAGVATFSAGQGQAATAGTVQFASSGSVQVAESKYVLSDKDDMFLSQGIEQLNAEVEAFLGGIPVKEQPVAPSINLDMPISLAVQGQGVNIPTEEVELLEQSVAEICVANSQRYPSESCDEIDLSQPIERGQMQWAIQKILGENGWLDRTQVNYKVRAGQLQMASSFGDSLFDENSTLQLIEAGTGLGKTYAYLIPILLAKRSALISTETKVLQDQIIGTDLPHLISLLGLQNEVTIASLKGVGNYLCHFKLDKLKPNVYEHHLQAYYHKMLKDAKDANKPEKVSRIEEWLEDIDKEASNEFSDILSKLSKLNDTEQAELFSELIRLCKYFLEDERILSFDSKLLPANFWEADFALKQFVEERSMLHQVIRPKIAAVKLLREHWLEIKHLFSCNLSQCKKCPRFLSQNSNYICAYQQAYQRACESQITLINHSLLVSKALPRNTVFDFITTVNGEHKQELDYDVVVTEHAEFADYAAQEVNESTALWASSHTGQAAVSKVTWEHPLGQEEPALAQGNNLANVDPDVINCDQILEGRQVLVCDEAHALEHCFGNHYSSTLSSEALQEFIKALNGIDINDSQLRDKVIQDVWLLMRAFALVPVGEYDFREFKYQPAQGTWLYGFYNSLDAYQGWALNFPPREKNSKLHKLKHDSSDMLMLNQEFCAFLFSFVEGLQQLSCVCHKLASENEDSKFAFLGGQASRIADFLRNLKAHDDNENLDLRSFAKLEIKQSLFAEFQSNGQIRGYSELSHHINSNWENKLLKEVQFELTLHPVSLSIFSKTFFALLQKLQCTPMLTSATLRSWFEYLGDFSFDPFVSKLLGATNPVLPVRNMVFASPFDYRSNTFAWCSPLFDNSLDQFYKPKVKNILRNMSLVADVINEIEGGILILVKSYDVLDVYHNVLSQLLDSVLRGHELYCQEKNQSLELVVDRYLHCLNQGGRPILVGTASCWTGLNLPGKALQMLIIDRLPFSPFDLEYYIASEQNRNYFKEQYLPNMYLQLKQGMGRLIRAENDWGVIVLFDSRALEQRYHRGVVSCLNYNMLHSDHTAKQACEFVKAHKNAEQNPVQ